MLTYADVCSEFLETQALSLWSEVWEVLRMLTYADVC
jgi:hypothetical protein